MAPHRALSFGILIVPFLNASNKGTSSLLSSMSNIRPTLE
jgi:hypothetical protein